MEGIIEFIFGLPLHIDNTRSFHNDVIRVLSSITYSEAVAVTLRIKAKMTLKQIGVILEVSPQRAGQILHRAKKKLSHPSRAKRLLKYIGGNNERITGRDSEKVFTGP